MGQWGIATVAKETVLALTILTVQVRSCEAVLPMPDSRPSRGDTYFSLSVL